jgi:hypothetical protein
MNAAIATHLNVAEQAIVEIQEWATVLWVRVKGLGARFVSKRVAEMEKTDVEKLEEVGNRWAGYGKDRIYFEQSTIKRVLGLSNSKYRQLGGSKFFYNVQDGKFYEQMTGVVHGVTGCKWVDGIKQLAGLD